MSLFIMDISIWPKAFSKRATSIAMSNPFLNLLDYQVNFIPLERVTVTGCAEIVPTPATSINARDKKAFFINLTFFILITKNLQSGWYTRLMSQI